MIGCGLSLSKTSKSSCTRPGTSRPCASTTVTNSDTTCVPDLKVGCCWASTTSDTVRPIAATTAGNFIASAYRIGVWLPCDARLDRSDIGEYTVSSFLDSGSFWDRPLHMLQAFVITWREGLEAFLIVAISLSFLRKSGRSTL